LRKGTKRLSNRNSKRAEAICDWVSEQAPEPL